MKNTLAKIVLSACLGAVLVAAPSSGRAQASTNAPAAQTPAPKKHGTPFKGKVASVDATALTFIVGATSTNVIAITSTTKITKDGQPAVFADITVGAWVTGSYKKDADGKNNAASVKIGEPKKKEKPAVAPAP